jgi:hypothetical protein
MWATWVIFKKLSEIINYPESNTPVELWCMYVYVMYKSFYYFDRSGTRNCNFLLESTILITFCVQFVHIDTTMQYDFLRIQYFDHFSWIICCIWIQTFDFLSMFSGENICNSRTSTLCSRPGLSDWYIFKPKIPIWVNFGGFCNGIC